MRALYPTAVLCLLAGSALAQNSYHATTLVANDEKYHPTIMVDPLLQNGWGVAIRPPGAGGHFWISNFASGTTTTYQGDVNGVPLHQDSLTVDIGYGSGLRVDGRPVADPPQPTGQVYNYSTTDFVVSGEGITNASKFIFVTGEGTISGWTELPDPAHPGQLLRQTTSVVTVDQSPEYDDDRLRFTGCAVTDFPGNNRLYVTNYITNEVEVYDANWQRIPMPAGRFFFPDMPPDGYHVWNIQYFHSGPNGEGRLWVAYALGDDPWEQDPTHGYAAEFDLDGNYIRRLTLACDLDPWADGELRVPWGLAFAPADFGPFSGALLVANFGDGTIAAFDPHTTRFIDFLRDEEGEPISIDGIWGLTFGNGVALGDSNALYFTAGPNNEQDGLFGSIRFAPFCTADFNHSGATPDDSDVAAFFAAWNDGEDSADVNQSGGVPDDADVSFFFIHWAEGC
jgi:uncharacterized protein (TIGR03118 family)